MAFYLRFCLESFSKAQSPYWLETLLEFSTLNILTAYPYYTVFTLAVPFSLNVSSRMHFLQQAYLLKPWFHLVKQAGPSQAPLTKLPFPLLLSVPL